MGAAIRDGIMVRAGVVGTVGGHRADLFADRDLPEKIGQDRCITNVAPCDLASPNLQRFLFDAEVDLASDPPFGAAMLAGVPLAFALDLDARAFDEQMQRALRPTVGDVDG